MFRFGGFGDNALKLPIHAYAKTRAYAGFMRIQEEGLMQIAAIARGQGCRLVLPLTHFTPEHVGSGLPVATVGIEA